MDAYEATKLVMSRVQSLDPENSSKIMGYILIQDLGEKEMIRLAFGPEILLLSHINQARAFLGPRNGSASSRLNLYTNEVMSPSGRSDSFEEVNNGTPFHRRSCSVNDASILLSNLEDMGGFGWKPCMYFARGFCKNGTSCKFLHSEGESSVDMLGSPNGGFDELLRMKAIQQQRASLEASYSKNIDKFRSDFSQMGLVSIANSSSRQIYLTFPADSTFKEEDVSTYFSMFGPVQDVRIPYQQKRMFGFVSFVYAETVKQILAKGNPHFVCDSRVLVKPYKEKGKIPDKKQQYYQNMERGDYLTCLSPTELDSRESIDSPLGSRMLYGTREMMLRRKLEEVDLQQAIEFQSRRMMNLQLMDLKNQQHNHHLLSSFAAFDGIEELNGMQEASESTDKLLKGFDSNLPRSFELILPDDLFASPTKLKSRASADGTIPVTMSSSNNDNPSGPNMRSLYSPMPRVLSGQEAVNM